MRSAVRRRADPSATHLPGDGAMWVMVLGDLVIFGGYFIVYLVHRAMSPATFLSAQQHLDVTIGVLNTMVLLSSSLLVARSVYATRSDRHKRAVVLIYAAGFCGVVFVAIKAYEWSTKIAAERTVSNEFFSFYYVLTGVHMFHVALGLIILGVCVRELRSPLRRRVSLVEQGATYWHMVDLLWIVIFGLLYVMR
ncbi:heme/copper-type cytochrome/quinol oxidase, subunit 3 [Mycolicibacterium rhodesiae NBB3]|uniref:Probable cytochrome c oxidase subunit 3 n=1 Tax=Mycolicibacterium rhodesiae (strain NBB3) TaxID=710685 RepID=G8RV76_MYCRN|nr:heme/copper-type cytochrome/quinol oxidase, subunit 3 [Mycolicibacterium rhodesiae NBB3]